MVFKILKIFLVASSHGECLVSTLMMSKLYCESMKIQRETIGELRKTEHELMTISHVHWLINYCSQFIQACRILRPLLGGQKA